jgi:uncharacterized membrane protein
MSKGRLEAFSDGVIAILITIMVLELKPPHEGTWEALRPLWPVMTSYVLSFVYLGIYWNNHHHLLQAVRRVNGRILWANLHLLFWLSLVPVATAWMGESHFAPLAVAAYGVPLILAGVAYYILERALIAHHPDDSTLAAAVGADVKGIVSVVVYAVAIAVSFALPWLSCALYAAVAAWWLVPDRRIERALGARS